MTIEARTRSGTIQLDSGRWHWTLLPRWTGATIVFQHRERLHDEMRSWTPEQELSEDEARELAVDALERTWVDKDGLKWRLSMEIPSSWRNPGDEVSALSGMVLVFKRGGFRRSVPMPEDASMGHLSHGDLTRLLEEASAVENDLSD